MLAPGGRILNGSFDEVSEVDDYCKLLGIYLDQICVELIRYHRHNRLIERCLPKEQAILQLPPLNLLTQLEILVWHPRKAMFMTSIKGCTGTYQFRNQESWNDWVWVQAASEEVYGALRACLRQRSWGFLTPGTAAQKLCGG